MGEGPPAAWHAPPTGHGRLPYPGEMDHDRRPENLLGVVLDAYWTSLASDPLPALLLTGLLSLAGVLAVLLGHIVADMIGQLLGYLS
jgi:hypothetical protein